MHNLNKYFEYICLSFDSWIIHSLSCCGKWKNKIQNIFKTQLRIDEILFKYDDINENDSSCEAVIFVC